MMMMMMMMINDNDNDNKIAEVSAIWEGGVRVCVCVWGGHTSLHDYTRMCHLTILKLVLWFYNGEQVVNGV